MSPSTPSRSRAGCAEVPVTPKSLTTCLRRLERNGVVEVVERLVGSTDPVAIEYRITSLGRTLQSPLRAMLGWVVDHLDAVEGARSRYDERRTRS
ncbi:helix-turn-helix domain-containing protein [Streptomyces sp. NPDC005271]|uniref:winged helix-turn-helix transcriptional regulator n=1 Tax=unclassified Streptomyces TaxID=2593676 RepID=UPI0033B51BDE